MFNHTQCPVCKQTKFSHFLNCKDYTVSQETFSIVSCDACDFKFTNPIPDISRLGDYYKAESYISHTDTKKGVIARLYHAVRSFTLRGKLKLLERNVARGTILDYGCGTGMFLKTCKNAGWKVVGVEPDSGAASIAKREGDKVVSSISELKGTLRGEKFNAITLWHVLEHVTDLQETLFFFNENLDSNGALIIAVPNYTSYDANYYKEFWAAYDVPRHLYHFNPTSLERLLSGFGFQLTETLPMKFDSYYVSMLSEKYKTGAVRYGSAFYRGWLSNLKASKAKDYSSLIYIFKKV